MGTLKERYLEIQELRHLNLARALSISWEDLASLEFDVDVNMSKEGLIYGYTIVFDNNNDENLLNKIQGLDSGLKIELDPWVFERTEDEEYELSAITENKDYKNNFMEEIRTIERLYEIKLEDISLRKALLRQIFVSTIGILETYLSDAFINKALSSEYYIEKFVNNHPEFKKEKINISEIFSISRTIKEKAKTVMVGTIYHKLHIVKEMYESTFDITFPDISEIQKYITQRHDLVHRNGKTKSGKILHINEKKIQALIYSTTQFVEQVSTTLEEDDIPF